MTDSIWLKIADRFAAVNSDAHRQIIAYGLSKLTTIVVNYAILAVIGILFGQLIGCMIFLTAFMILRMYAGGYHASTKFTCFVVSYMVELFGVSAICLLPYRPFMILIILLCCVLITILAPVEAVNKPLSVRERTVYKRLAAFISMVYVAASVLFIIVGAERILVAVLSAVVEVLLLMVPGVLQNAKRRTA